VRVEEGAGPPVKGSLIGVDWKSKEKKEETFQRDSTRLHKKEIYLHKCKTLSTKVLGLHVTKEFLHSKGEIKSYKEAKSTPPQHFAPWHKKA
jgi:hypothetical protein